MQKQLSYRCDGQTALQVYVCPQQFLLCLKLYREYSRAMLYQSSECKGSVSAFRMLIYSMLTCSFNTFRHNTTTYTCTVIQYAYLSST